MTMIGSHKLRQYVGVKGITFGLTHAKTVPGPIQRLGVHRIDHHPVVQKKIHDSSLRLLDGRPKLHSLASALIEKTTKLSQPPNALLNLFLAYLLALRIADPDLVKLIGPIDSQIISLQWLLLLAVVPIPSALNGMFALYRSSTKGPLSIESQLRSLTGRDSLSLILRWVIG